MDWKQISTSQSLFYCPNVFTNAAGFKQTGRDTLVQRSSGVQQQPSDSPAGQNKIKVTHFLISRYLFHCLTAFQGTLNQTIAFLLCLNPVHRQRVCEKLYHKMGYERKKKLAEKREHAQFRLMSSSCVTSLSFSVFFFFLSLCLSLGLIRPAVEPGPPGKRSRVWLELRLNWGGWRRRGCKLGGENFRPFSPCNTARSLASWQAAGCSLPSVFFPFTPPLTSFPSYFSCSPPLHPSPFPPHDFQRPPPLFSSFSYSSSCCPPFHGGGCGKLTLSLFNDAFQTSAQWHHNKPRSSL